MSHTWNYLSEHVCFATCRVIQSNSNIALEQPLMCYCFWKSLHILRLHPGIVLLSKIEWDWTTPCSWLEKKKQLRSTQGSAGQHRLATLKQAESCFMLQRHAACTFRTTNYDCYYTLYEQINADLYCKSIHFLSKVPCLFSATLIQKKNHSGSDNCPSNEVLLTHWRQGGVESLQHKQKRLSLTLSPSLCAQ